PGNILVRSSIAWNASRDANRCWKYCPPGKWASQAGWICVASAMHSLCNVYCCIGEIHAFVLVWPPSWIATPQPAPDGRGAERSGAGAVAIVMNRSRLLQALPAAPLLLAAGAAPAAERTAEDVERIRSTWRKLAPAGLEVPSVRDKVSLSEEQ